MCHAPVAARPQRHTQRRHHGRLAIGTSRPSEVQPHRLRRGALTQTPRVPILAVPAAVRGMRPADDMACTLYFSRNPNPRLAVAVARHLKAPVDFQFALSNVASDCGSGGSPAQRKPENSWRRPARTASMKAASTGTNISTKSTERTPSIWV